MPETSSSKRATRTTQTRSQGADVVVGGVRYRTWCKHDRAAVVVVDKNSAPLRTIQLAPEEKGYFSGIDATGAAGDRYLYQFGESQAWPDPASRFQPDGVHGPSLVVDPQTYRWRDDTWTAPSFPTLIIYELHLGTFTPEGTFRSAIERLEHLAALGITALEIMPVGDFPGERNWGYDGVMPYAPARAYGAPDDFRALVDAAHALGLAVILDVVYNHLGPAGNYTGVYHHDYQNEALHTPWGAALNYTVAPARAFFSENAPYWTREFHIDGFRLDATHEIADPSERHLLAEIAAAVHSLGGFVIAEDERNEPQLLTPAGRGGLGFDAAWADDFHHVVRVMLTGEREGYYANYAGTGAELARTIEQGWLFCGQPESSTGLPRGGDPAGLQPPQFVYCISNHDQVGNRAFGERLGQAISPAAYRAASALLCLVPQTPMLFMGQEWGASTPFQFFTDHNPELGRLVTEGRRREFQNFAAFRDPAVRQTIPDPQAPRTFANSKLRWEELQAPEHAAVLLLYREFLKLRQTHPAFHQRSRDKFFVAEPAPGVVAILFGRPSEEQCLVLADLSGAHAMPPLDHPRLVPGGRKWQPLLSSNEVRFGGETAPPVRMPTTLVLEAG
ncbi:MAG: malto-oligosyltrehalose trehalohydrolase [Chthoniobacterales bacterium]